MDARFITKKITTLVIGTSVSGTVVTLIHANTPTFKTSQKAKLYIGAAVLGMMITEKAEEWTDKKVDAIFDWYETTFKTTESSKQ
jgi:hypothetical protein